MAQVIDGTALAKKLQLDLVSRLSTLATKIKVVSLLIGDDPASLKYSELKQKKAKELGINFELEKFPAESPVDEISQKITVLNTDPSVTGIMIQLPAPEGLVELINPQKDIDGLLKNSPFLPATVRGVLAILEELKIDFHTQTFGVVGSDGQIGRSIVKILNEKGAQIVEVDIKNPASNHKELKVADVVISCTGENNLIKADDVKDGFVAIDVGLGDFSQAALDKFAFYTPKVGGVGPMTVISLMANIVDAVT